MNFSALFSLSLFVCLYISFCSIRSRQKPELRSQLLGQSSLWCLQHSPQRKNVSLSTSRVSALYRRVWWLLRAGNVYLSQVQHSLYFRENRRWLFGWRFEPFLPGVMETLTPMVTEQKLLAPIAVDIWTRVSRRTLTRQTLHCVKD